LKSQKTPKNYNGYIKNTKLTKRNQHTWWRNWWGSRIRWTDISV